MYGQNQYGTKRYAAETSDGEREEYYVNLFPLVPAFVSEKKEMHALYETQGYEVGYLEHVIEDVIDQCFITSATWGLMRWEKFLKVDTNLLLTYEQRRELLFAKLRGQGTTTVEMIKDTAEAFSGIEVEVIEDAAHYRFTVRFVGKKGIPQNMQGFVTMLEAIKPAHLAYDFEYRFTTWQEALNYTWEEAQRYSWEEFRILEEERTCY